VASFVDTNVLVYAFDSGDARKRQISLDLLDDASLSLVLSTQVLLEFYGVVTRRLEPPLDAEEAHDVVRHLSMGEVVSPDAALVDAAIALARRHRLALWDAAIVAAAQRAGCHELLTEDLGDGTTIEGVTIRDPFRTNPA
jgi:predicted nucleic acid-binding protein